MDSIVIIGTSHIANQSVKEVEQAVEVHKPDIIAIELDSKRLGGLMSKKKGSVSFRDISRIGVKGFFFALLASWAERKLGDQVGMKPGAEMKRAVEIARENKLKLALIDQDIEITLRRLSESLTWKEKWNFIKDLFRGFVLRKPDITFDLRTVPEDKIIEKMLEQVRDKYPNVYSVLITERNDVMARNLLALHAKNPDKKIVAVVGAGHLEKIRSMVLEGLQAHEPRITYSLPDGFALDEG